jgi:hypothetical protein
MVARHANRRPIRCRDCGGWRMDDELFWRGRCEDCRDKRSAARRAATGARALALAKDAGTLERDGQTFRVLLLPPKRRGGSRIRH